MTALPVPPSSASFQPMTAAEYAALPEDSDHDYELQDGHLIMSAKPTPRHQRALFELGVQLRSQVPAHLQLLLDVDIGYVDEPPVSGTFTTQHPFPARLDLGVLA